MDNATDVLGLLAQRREIVQQIADGGASKRALALEQPHSRSTISRVLRDLTAAQLVHKDGSDYELTGPGRIAYREFRRIAERYTGLGNALPLLDHLPDATALPGVLFEEATVIQPARPNPDAPRTRLAECVRRSAEIVGMTPIVSQRLIGMFHDALTTHEVQLSLLLSEQGTAHLWNTYREQIVTALASERCTIRTREQVPPFSLVIMDRAEVWLGVYTESGQLQGMLQSKASGAVEWAEQVLQHQIELATSVATDQGATETDLSCRWGPPTRLTAQTHQDTLS